jgi:hypothetical protein
VEEEEGSINNKITWCNGVLNGSIMYGGPNADKFDCGSSIASSSAIVMDYNPNEGDTISGSCKLVNTVRDANNNNNIPNINLPDTGDTIDNSNILSSGEDSK